MFLCQIRTVYLHVSVIFELFHPSRNESGHQWSVCLCVCGQWPVPQIHISHILSPFGVLSLLFSVAFRLPHWPVASLGWRRRHVVAGAVRLWGQPPPCPGAAAASASCQSSLAIRRRLAGLRIHCNMLSSYCVRCPGVVYVFGQIASRQLPVASLHFQASPLPAFLARLLPTAAPRHRSVAKRCRLAARLRHRCGQRASRSSSVCACKRVSAPVASRPLTAKKTRP